MAMSRGRIEHARKKALEFIAHCDQMLTELDAKLERQRYDSEKRAWVTTEAKPTPGDQSWGSRASGALRRNSMDLTRTLADLRRP